MKKINLTGRDIFNARNSASLKDSVGVVGFLNGVAYDDENEGKHVCIIKIDGTIYSGTSATVYEDCKLLIDEFSKEIESGELKVSIDAHTSKGGRTFLNVNLEE